MTVMIDRRLLLLSPLALALPSTARADEAAAALLRRGGVVAAFRHATAPGTYDPPGFRLDDCSTQRNLSDDGRAQARRLGDWFRQRQLGPRAVRSSPWCRCVDTATLAFGSPERWAALGSPRGVSESAGAEHLGLLRQALQRSRTQAGFEVWVTHMFVLSDLVGTGTASGEGLVLQADAQGRPAVVGRIVVT
jgi:phosphohistidine phosphatase SixA